MGGGHSRFGETLRRSDHPVCAASVSSRHSSDGAASPPLRGGEYYATIIRASSFASIARRSPLIPSSSIMTRGCDYEPERSIVLPMARASIRIEDDRLRFSDVQRRLKAIFIGSVGNLVEWYDFYVYTAFALYFAASFFPGNNLVIQQLNAAILFAIGFIVRPVGGWLFVHLADHYGRRNALIRSVLLVCLGSLMIAVTPTYASIGAAAPALLGFARVIQGLSLGVEYGASATYQIGRAHV